MPIDHYLIPDYSHLYKHDEHSDIHIHVGKGSDLTVFRVHLQVLCKRSSYFNQSFSDDVKNSKTQAQGEALTSIEAFNIYYRDLSPIAFGSILRYMYMGKLSPSKHQYLELLEVVKIANKFALKKLVEALLRTISEELVCLLEKNLISTMITAEDERFDALERRCLAIIEESPEAVLLSNDFLKCNKNLLIAQLKKDRLDMGEAEIWDCILNWSIAQANVSSDSNNWSADDIATLKMIIAEVAPHLRLFYMKQPDFLEREPIMEKLLPEALHKVLKQFYLANGNNQNITLPKPRVRFPIINSILINKEQARWIAQHIRRQTPSSSRNSFDMDPFCDFELLLSGSLDGFTPTIFHRTCDNKGPTIVVAKIKNSNEIVGGYCPLDWKSPRKEYYGNCSDSFIFAFHGNGLHNAKYSHVQEANHAIFFTADSGPCFGYNGADLYFGGKKPACSTQRESYSIPIRNSNNWFAIMDYEVFQVVKRD
ncbi:4313_t:CDS:2 [Paraglomus brasilianum]|uniref:4313_t:CDS:1 n=1 Tax=Paraglomus brasilianum TaxID=144538 RepID=A0A9N9BLR6_9GLOM|nr:4313_t:CDS:2 [Paraglomus brasilianum]